MHASNRHRPSSHETASLRALLAVACLGQLAGCGMSYEAPDGGGIVVVSYPFVLEQVP